MLNGFVQYISKIANDLNGHMKSKGAISALQICFGITKLHVIGQITDFSIVASLSVHNQIFHLSYKIEPSLSHQAECCINIRLCGGFNMKEL